MDNDMPAGPRWGRALLWTALSVIGFVVAMIALGFIAAHLDAGTGEQVWRARFLFGGVPALILIATALLVARKTRVPGDASEGVRREAIVRRRFWGWNGAAAVFGVLTVVWLRASAPGFSLLSGDALPTTPAVVLSLLYLIGGGWAAYVWYTRIDELEQADNLWAGSIATTAVLMIYPAWYLLSRARLIAEPAHWAAYTLLLVTYCAVYLGRKLRR